MSDTGETYFATYRVRQADDDCGVRPSSLLVRPAEIKDVDDLAALHCERADAAFYFVNALNRASIALHAGFHFEEITRDFVYPGAVFRGGVRRPLSSSTVCGMQTPCGAETVNPAWYEAIYKSLDRAPFDVGSPLLILVAQKS